MAEYLAALDEARGTEDRHDGDNDRKPPKPISLTDPQAAWCEEEDEPVLCLDANYLIDNKLGIIAMPRVHEPTAVMRPPSPRR